MEKELYQTTLPFTVFEPDMLSGSLTLTAQEWGLESHFRQTCNMKIQNYKNTNSALECSPHTTSIKFFIWTLVLVTKPYIRKISN